MANKIRSGLDRIRTHVNRRMSAGQQTHELYMKLTSLEIERTRRMTERDATAKRLQTIDDRIANIETEQDAVKTKLNLVPGAERPKSAIQSKSVQNGQLRY